MTRFENAPFSERIKELGDTAEAVFEKWAERHGIIFIRLGLNRPPFKHLFKVSKLIRLIPDYLCEGTDTVLVEVKGCGSEGLKIKHESFDIMAVWNAIQPVRIFVYNSSSNATTLLTMDDLAELRMTKEVQAFPDGKLYVTIPINEMTWEPWKN